VRTTTTGALSLCLAGLLALPAEARACGVWRLSDLEQKRDAVFYVSSILTGKKGGRERPVAHVSTKRPRRCSVGGLHLQLVDGAYRVGKRARATIDGNSVTIGKRIWAVEIAPTRSPAAHPPYEWDVTVRAGGTVVGQGLAMAFSTCAADESPEAKRRDILERVACYLVASR
jgi:hypothetical protein